MEDAVTTDLRVRFGQEGQSCLALEIDYRDGGLNGGRRAFASGETAMGGAPPLYLETT